MGEYYTLENRKAVPCDVHVWAKMCRDIGSRRVAKTNIGDVLVSTVFLGLDDSFVDGPPMLFETMVFGLSEGDEWQERCSTWGQAEAMHSEMCERAIAYNNQKNEGN